MVWGYAGRELLWAAKLHRFLQAAYSYREVLRWRDLRCARSTRPISNSRVARLLFKHRANASSGAKLANSVARSPEIGYAVRKQITVRRRLPCRNQQSRSL